MKRLLKSKKGFTLIELIVVIAILAVLALILVPSMTGYLASSREAAAEASARSVYSEAMLAAATDVASYTAPADCAITGTYPNAITGATCTIQGVTGTYVAP